MASIVKIKRSSVQGKKPTTSEITGGELALNTRDGKLFSSDGTTTFEVGANLHSLSVGTGGLTFANGAMTLPTSDGIMNQVLKTDGNGNVFWDGAGVGSGTFQFYKNIGTATLVADGIAVSGGAFPFYRQDGTADSIPVA
jgi:hypothetical protein